MDGAAAAGAIAHKRVKRAMGLLRAAARDLAPEAAEVDVIAEHRLLAGEPLDELVELLALARRDRPEVDVIVVARR